MKTLIYVGNIIHILSQLPAASGSPTGFKVYLQPFQIGLNRPLSYKIQSIQG